MKININNLDAFYYNGKNFDELKNWAGSMSAGVEYPCNGYYAMLGDRIYHFEESESIEVVYEAETTQIMTFDGSANSVAAINNELGTSFSFSDGVMVNDAVTFKNFYKTNVLKAGAKIFKQEGKIYVAEDVS